MAAGHFISNGDFPLLGDIDVYHLIDPCREGVVFFRIVEDFDIHNNPALAMRHPQGIIFHIPGFLPEDGPEELLLCSWFRFPFRRDLPYQDISSLHFSPDPDDPFLVQVCNGILAHIGNLPGNLFPAQFSVSGVAGMLLDMDGSVHVILNQLFADQDGILIVVAFPGHEGHQDVPSQSQLSVIYRRPVSQDIPLLHHISLADNGLLIDAGSLVGAAELDHIICVCIPFYIAHRDFITSGLLYNPVIFGQDAYSCILGSPFFHSGPYNRRL